MEGRNQLILPHSQFRTDQSLSYSHRFSTLTESAVNSNHSNRVPSMNDENNYYANLAVPYSPYHGSATSTNTSVISESDSGSTDVDTIEFGFEFENDIYFTNHIDYEVDNSTTANSSPLDEDIALYLSEEPLY